jgi:hypothetical protein
MNNNLLIILCKLIKGKKVSYSKLTQLVYLVDWKNVLLFNKQLTDIQWILEPWGPSPKNLDIKKELENKTLFFQIEKDLYATNLNFELDCNYESVNHVVHTTSKMSDREISKLVRSTYPVMSGGNYRQIDLICKAIKYDELSDLKMEKT